MEALGNKKIIPFIHLIKNEICPVLLFRHPVLAEHYRVEIEALGCKRIIPFVQKYLDLVTQHVCLFLSIRYLRASLAGEKTSQPTDALLALVDTFVLCKVKATSKIEVKGQKLEGFLSPVEEMQLLMAIHSQLEEQQSLELRYCMFEAIFGGSGADKQVPARTASFSDS